MTLHRVSHLCPRLVVRKEARLHLAAVGRTRRSGLSRLNVVHRQDAAALVFAGTELQAPPTLAPALEYIRDHERFQVGDLPGDVAETEKAQLVSRLIVEGVLRRCRP